MTIDRGTVLLPIARNAISSALGNPLNMPEDALWLQEPGATFVTLMQQGGLRGCIGSLEARRPLLEDVKANARAAAFRDPRFSPLAPEELPLTEIEVSLLSPLTPLRCKNRDEALDHLNPGIDGVVFEYAHCRSTFLPQVWERLSDPEQFLESLVRKAGLPAGFWADGIRLYRYTVSKWTESELSVGGPYRQRGSIHE